MTSAKHSYQDPEKSDWIKGIVSITVYLAVISVTAFLLLVEYWYLWLIIIFGGLTLLINWHTHSYAYRCRNCGSEFEIPFLANLIAPHGLDKEGAWSWLKCPKCRSRHKTTVIKIIKSKQERVLPSKYVHTNLIAKDWRVLASFYQDVFGCVPIPPERDLSGEWIDQATNIPDTHITGMHLQLPGYGDNGPTLEIFQYDRMPEHPLIQPNTPGFAHIAFAVDDVHATAHAVFEHGGSTIGDLTEHQIPGLGVITFQYLADPEGNVIEIQKVDP